jgi:hypothetical protein
MYNNYLADSDNAVLTWELTGARAKNTGVLIIQNRNIYKSLFGTIMEKGNLIPVFISAVILIILGFWMVIPVFGIVFNEKKKHSRPILDRFLAETRFLKKYHALDYYIKIYRREFKLEKSGDSVYNYRNILNELKEHQRRES